MSVSHRIGRVLLCGALGPGCFSENPALPQDPSTTGADASDDGVTTAVAGGSSSAGTSSGSTTDEVTSSGGSPSACGELGTCLSPPPLGWAGPVLLSDSARGEAGPGCPAASTELDIALSFGLVAVPAACTCTCGTAQDAACGSTEAEYYGTDSRCEALEASFAMTYDGSGGSCVDGPNGAASAYWRIPPLGVVGGFCDPSASATLDEPTWGGGTRVCDVDLSRGTQCGFDGVCAPNLGIETFDEGYCVWRQGEHECPGPDYPVRQLRWTGLEDERSCSECTCSEPTGECAGDVWLYGDDGCGGTLQRVATDGACQLVDLEVESGRLRETAPGCGGPCQVLVTASCGPQGGDPLGDVNPVDPYTFCCTG